MTFTRKETILVDSLLKPFRELIKSNPQLEDDFLEKMVDQRIEGIISEPAREMLEGIKYKLAMKKADAEIEKILSTP